MMSNGQPVEEKEAFLKELIESINDEIIWGELGEFFTKLEPLLNDL